MHSCYNVSWTKSMYARINMTLIAIDALIAYFSCVFAL